MVFSPWAQFIGLHELDYGVYSPQNKGEAKGATSKRLKSMKCSKLRKVMQLRRVVNDEDCR